MEREHYYTFVEIFSTDKNKLAGAKILKEISVPKKDLVAAGVVIMQQGRVRVAPGRWNEDFKRQLAKFKGKVNEATGNRKYEAAAEEDHDDLVVCYLMGAWWILNRRERNANPERVSTPNTTTGWEPDDYM
jgi:hypothetical protein